MTEAIKQWIADEAQGNAGWTGLLSDNSRSIYCNGLTKGIEIAEGFAEFADQYLFNPATARWVSMSDFKPGVPATEAKALTTSQLLEKYLEALNKEKA